MLPDGLPSLVFLCVIVPCAWVLGNCYFKTFSTLKNILTVAACECVVFWPWAVANSIAGKRLDGGAVTFLIALVCTSFEMRFILRAESIRCTRFLVSASYFLVFLNYVGGSIVFDKTLLIIYCGLAAAFWLVLSIVHLYISSYWDAKISHSDK